MKDAPPWLLAISFLFVAGLASLLVASFFRPTPEEHAPTPSRPWEVGERTIEGRYTVDARDPGRWVFFDFSRASVVTDPGPRAWDLAFRRFHVVANGGPGYQGEGGALRLAAEDAAWSDLPPDGYVGTRGSLEEEATHPVLAEWYDYGFFTHLLTPVSAIFAVRTADGRFAALRFLGYYCPGAVPGCVTFRYVYRGDGGRALPHLLSPP